MKILKSLIKNSLILIVVFIVGVSIAAVIFISDTPNFSFNYKNLLNLDKNKPGKVEENLTDNVTKRVVVLEENAVIDVIEKSKPSVVSVVAERTVVNPFLGNSTTQSSGIGTGFIVEGGFVFTNKHVVDAEAKYSVLLNDGETSIPVIDVQKDPLSDFAILKLETQNIKLPELPLGDSDNLKVGQTVIAIGNVLGEFSNTASKGIISGIGRSIVAQNGAYGVSELLDNVIQTDAALNPGNSGGPLLDLDGNVVGINVARAGAENVGFSIPINSIKSVYQSFKDFGVIKRPYIGVSYRMNTAPQSKINRVPVGAVIEQVMPGSPADKAKLEAGDVITKIDETPLNKDATLTRVIAQKQVGDTVTLTIDRGGKEMTLSLELQAAGESSSSQ